MQKYFKALIPFSSGAGIYNPSDKEPSKAKAELVDSWVEVGYCVEVVAPKDKPIKNEAPNKAFKPILEPVIEMVADEPKQPEKAQEEPKKGYDSMSYPQLKKAAKEAGIKGYQNMKQVDLIKALKGE